jgi:hypothetical protein
MSVGSVGSVSVGISIFSQSHSHFRLKPVIISGSLLYSSCLSEVSCVRVKPDQALSPQNGFHVGYQWGYFMVFLNPVVLLPITVRVAHIR